MPITPTTLLNTGLQRLGSVSQGAASVTANVATQAAKTDAAGTSDSVKAQREANETQDKNGAAMIAMQSAAMVEKQTQDTLNGIAAGKQDTNNKAQSAMFANAKGISF